MEDIKLKSNRSLFIKILLPAVIIMFIIILIVIIELIFINTNDTEYKDLLMFLYIFGPFEFIFILIIILLKYKKGMNYIFTNELIFVYKKNVLQYQIETNLIITMTYYPLKLKYIIPGGITDGIP